VKLKRKKYIEVLSNYESTQPTQKPKIRNFLSENELAKLRVSTQYKMSLIAINALPFTDFLKMLDYMDFQNHYKEQYQILNTPIKK
jgi:hypothetical protein